MNTSTSHFTGRSLVVVTKHGKERVIAPLLEKRLGVVCHLSQVIDTDAFGTFSGEVKRVSTALDTARAKCNAGFKQSNHSLAVSSEGSFGPHPYVPFSNADQEIVLIKDSKYNIELIGQAISADTNFSKATVNSIQELEAFAASAKFPSHGLIIKSGEDNQRRVFKGITLPQDLHGAFKKAQKLSIDVDVETDMRALYNPSRMRVIKEATLKAIQLAHSLCPECDMPGFQIQNAIPGLPCKRCNFPTKTVEFHNYVCQRCDYNEEKLANENKTHEDAMFCDYCNP